MFNFTLKYTHILEPHVKISENVKLSSFFNPEVSSVHERIYLMEHLQV